MSKKVLQRKVIQKKEEVTKNKFHLQKIMEHKVKNNQGELEEVIINKQTIKLYLN